MKKIFRVFFLFLFLILIPTSALASGQTILLVSDTNTKSAGYSNSPPVNPLDASSYSGKGWSSAVPVSNSYYSDSDDAPFGSGATWISSDISTLGGSGDQWRLYKADFDIPDGSAIISAQIWYSADNAVTVYLNDNEIGSTGYVFESPPGGDPDFSSGLWFFQKSCTNNFKPKIGANTLKFIVRNWASSKDTSNPTGLLYKAIIQYEMQIPTTTGYSTSDKILLTPNPTPTPSGAQVQSISTFTNTGGDQSSQFVFPLVILIVLIGGIGGLYYLRIKNSSLPTSVSRKPESMNVPQNPVDRFTPKPQTPKQLPQELSDQYTESEFIGKGGFARVFKAKRKDGRYVAVKIPISIDTATGKSFIAELQNWTKLDQSNIVRVYDYNIMPLPYFEMELCDSSLADMKKPIETEEAAWILFNVCEGLKYAHKRSIVHRDLKPQNILLKNGIPKISDWGLSKVISESTSTTATSFTPYYAAPEQVNNRQKDERTDIWQLGVILYELSTGELPFKGDSIVEIALNISTKDPRKPSEIRLESKPIEPVILKCLEKDPVKRYQSVLELQKVLALYLRKNYSEQLTMSVSTHDFNKSAFYCGDLVMINLLTGDIATAYKYILDLATYAEGEVKNDALELSEQIRNRMEYGINEIPDELIKKAEFIVYKVSRGFRKM